MAGARKKECDAKPKEHRGQRESTDRHGRSPQVRSGFLDKQFHEEEKSGYKDQEENHVVDMIPVFAPASLAQVVLDLLVGHVGLFAQRLALVVDVVLVVVFDQETVPVDEKSVIEKVDDKEKAEKIVQIVIQDHGRAAWTRRDVRSEGTVIVSLWGMVGAPFGFGWSIVFAFHTKAYEKKQQREHRKRDSEKKGAEPFGHVVRSVAGGVIPLLDAWVSAGSTGGRFPGGRTAEKMGQCAKGTSPAQPVRGPVSRFRRPVRPGRGRRRFVTRPSSRRGGHAAMKGLIDPVMSRQIARHGGVWSVTT
jgi:hypothetical protein